MENNVLVASYTFVVNKNESKNWFNFFKESISPTLSNSDFVHSFRLLKMLTEIDPSGVTYSVQLDFLNESDFENFNEKEFVKINAEMNALFNNQFAFFATLLKEV